MMVIFGLQQNLGWCTFLARALSSISFVYNAPRALTETKNQILGPQCYPQLSCTPMQPSPHDKPAGKGEGDEGGGSKEGWRCWSGRALAAVLHEIEVMSCLMAVANLRCTLRALGSTTSSGPPSQRRHDDDDDDDDNDDDAVEGMMVSLRLICYRGTCISAPRCSVFLYCVFSTTAQLKV